MGHTNRIAWALVLLAGAVGLGMFVGWNLALGSRPTVASGTASTGHLPTGHSALVVTTTARKAEVHRRIIGYGIARPASAALKTRSLPYECVILEEFVSVGQDVAAGQRLLSVRASQQERLAASKAKAELEAARELEKMTRSRIELELATRQDLVLAGLRVKQAQRVVDNMRQQGIDEDLDIRAKTAGIVANIGVQQGQIAPAGSALISLTDEEGLIVDLGIEPEDVRYLEQDQDVELQRVHSAGSKPIQARIKTVTRSVDPKTRLVRVLIQPEAGTGLMLHEFVEAHIGVGSHECIAVPGSSVLTDQGGQYLFTITDGRAQRVSVHTGLRGDEGVEILGDSIKAGDRVVTLGNHELQTGMQVREEGGPR